MADPRGGRSVMNDGASPLANMARGDALFCVPGLHEVMLEVGVDRVAGRVWDDPGPMGVEKDDIDFVNFGREFLTVHGAK